MGVMGNADARWEFPIYPIYPIYPIRPIFPILPILPILSKKRVTSNKKYYSLLFTNYSLPI